MPDQTLPVATADHEMRAAISEARATFGQFIDAFENTQPSQEHFLIKARFEEGDEVEHIWLADLDFSTDPATGTVANEPNIGSLKYMTRTSFTPAQISDWMYEENGELVGGFTTKLLKRRLAHPN